MAKMNLTLEEKLEEAIVKDAPYEVPRNWVWSKLGLVCKLSNGFAFKSINYKESGVPILRISNIQDSGITIAEKTVYSDENESLDKYIVKKNDLLIAMSGATTGKIGVYEDNKIAYLNQRVGNIRIVQPDLIIDKFRNYLISYRSKEILDLAYGGAQPNISTSMIESLHVPIPPLKEQQRIVDRIESLFEKLDKAMELIEEARVGFEKRKAAVLEKAFSGELTVELNIRDIQLELVNIEMDFPIFKSRYKLSNLGRIINEKPRNGYSPKAVEYETCTKTLKLGATTRGYFNPNEFKYIDEVIEKDSYLWLKKGDFLIQRANSLEYVGISAIYDMEDDLFIYPDLIMKFRVNEDIYYSRLLWYWVNSRCGRWYFTNNATGTAGNMPKINQKTVMNLPIPAIPFEEQKEIVKILDKLLEEESKIEELTQLEEQIELIKKSILAKAFRGELGTNCEEDESILDLLKEIFNKL